MLSNNDQAVTYVLLTKTLDKFESLLDIVESGFSDEAWELAQEVSEHLGNTLGRLKPQD